MVSPVIVAAQTGGKVFAWNVDANVGLRSTNRLDDVQLVQLGIVMLATGRPNYPDDLNQTLANVQLGQACTGQPDDPLCLAIVALENRLQPGRTPDGHVSALVDSVRFDDGTRGGRLYLLSVFNYFIAQGMTNWPRLDLIQGCPVELKKSVLATMIDQ